MFLTTMGKAAFLINGPLIFTIFNPPLTEGSTSLKKIGPGFLEEKLFKGQTTDRRTDDGRQVITIAHPEPLAQVS